MAQKPQKSVSAKPRKSGCLGPGSRATSVGEAEPLTRDTECRNLTRASKAPGPRVYSSHTSHSTLRNSSRNRPLKLRQGRISQRHSGSLPVTRKEIRTPGEWNLGSRAVGDLGMVIAKRYASVPESCDFDVGGKSC